MRLNIGVKFKFAWWPGQPTWGWWLIFSFFDTIGTLGSWACAQNIN